MNNEKKKIQTEYFVGATQSSSWSSVYYYAPQAPAIYQSKGEISACISLTSPPSFDSDKAGNLLLDQLHELYFESEEEDILLALEKACLSVQKRLLQLLQNDEISSEEGIDLHMSVAVLKEEFLYMCCIGDAKIIGYRENEVVDLSVVLKDPDGRSGLKVGSLELKPDDRFLLMSPRARDEISDIDIEKIFRKFSVESLAGKNFFIESLISLILVGYELNDIFQEEIVSTRKDEIIQQEHLVKNHFEDNVLAAEGDQVAENKMVHRQSILKKFDSQKVKDFFGVIAKKIKSIQNDKKAKTFQVVFANTTSTIWQFLQRIFKFLLQDILQINKKSNVYLRGAKKEFNWRPIVFFSVIIFIVGYFTVTSIREKRIKQENLAQAEQVISKAEKSYTSLDSQIRTLVTTYEREDEKKSLLNDLDTLKKDLNELDQEEMKDRKEELNSKISELQNKLERKIVIDNIEFIIDFGVIEGSDPSDIALHKENLFVSDQAMGVIYKFDKDGKRETLIDGLNKPSSLTTNEFGEVVFTDKNTDRAIGTVNIENKSLNRVRGLSLERVGNLSKMATYRIGAGDDRLYGLRSDSNQLIQMKRTGSDYSLPIVRFEEQSFGGLQDIYVHNGWIYLISTGEGVRRFFGEESENNVRGMLEGDNWNSASSIFVDERFIYLGDSSSKRVLIFTKARGEDTKILDFIAQYDLSNDQSSSNIKNLVADEDNIFVLAGTKIFKLPKSELQGFTY